MLLDFVFSHFGELRRFIKGFGLLNSILNKTGLNFSTSDLHINFSLCKMEITPTSSVTMRIQGENAHTGLTDT